MKGRPEIYDVVVSYVKISLCVSCRIIALF